MSRPRGARTGEEKPASITIRENRSIAAGVDAETSKLTLDASWQSLDADFAFVAACNLGGERMAPEQI